MTQLTMVEKILSSHTGHPVRAGDVADIEIDARVARDFGGASVVKNIQERGLDLADPHRTFFTFDCNPAGSDQKYAANQHQCRLFARRTGAGLFDVGSGIGTHLAIDRGLAWPGSTFVSTDSHANILGAIGAFGQGMGDIDIAAAFAQGRIWFNVPGSVRLRLLGRPGPLARAKDIALKILEVTGASGLLGCAAEVEGEIVDELSLDQRITIASMGTEMGAICLLFPPNQAVLEHCRQATGKTIEGLRADPGASYQAEITVDLDGLQPMIARPGKPHDTVPVDSVRGTPIDSGFVGSCTNGRWEDLQSVARLLQGRRVAPGVILKIVPTTDELWRRALDEGLLATFKQAGALVSSAGCAGCAEGQVGQNGPGETTLSTGNRNFPGKQGKGQVWLASPDTVVASTLVGAIATVEDLQGTISVRVRDREEASATKPVPAAPKAAERQPEVLEGRLYLVPIDDIDTDMIFHNRHLAITDLQGMGEHCFGNLDGHQGFPAWVRPGDVVWVGGNFGCGSSRQQAVDAFRALGVSALIARSYGSIYWRNAVNAGLPALTCSSDPVAFGAATGDRARVNLATGTIELPDKGLLIKAQPLGEVPLQIYHRGGLI